MTVRWKPLIVLSGVFLVVAAAGLVAIGFALAPASAKDILPLARAEVKAGEYDRAFIQFRRALQREPKNPAIHEEMAAMVEAWVAKEPAERVRLRPIRLRALADAAKYGPGRPVPLRALLADALAQDDQASAIAYAKSLLPLEAENPEANACLALAALDRQPPAVSEANTHLEVLRSRAPDSAQTRLVQARLAGTTRDADALARALEGIPPATEDSSPAEQLARMRLRGLDLERAEKAAELTPRVEALLVEARALMSQDNGSPGRLKQITRELDAARRTTLLLARTARPEEQESLANASTAVAQLAETVFTQSLEQMGAVDLSVHLAYAEHMLERGQRERCVEICDTALKLPMAAIPAWHRETAALREVAAKCLLGQADDPNRFDRAAPYIRDLIASTNPTYSGLGHLFQGLIDLEQSGISSVTAERAEANPLGDSKRKASARDHLAQAAERLRDSPTALALYGVSLVLSREPALGRQYLQTAMTKGTLEPRYQLWVAWSVIQAGYPEEAEPILNRLHSAIEAGELPADLAGTVGLLEGEMHEARRSPDELRKAKAAFERALAAGGSDNAPLELRIARIELALGETEAGTARLTRLRDPSKASVSTEQFAIAKLRGEGKAVEARKEIDAARARFPDSPELVALDAALWLDAEKPEQADSVLQTFLERHPEAHEVVVLRARLLSGPLKRPEDARKLLASAAEVADTSLPFVQLAMHDLSVGNLDAAAGSIANLRARFKATSAVDLLEAQLSLAKSDLRGASAALDAALEKDPNNKIARFWKARIAELTGDRDLARQVYQELVRQQPVKEIDEGLSLAAAAQWALATQAFMNRDFEQAIRRFRELDQGAPSALGRAARWRLAAAMVESGDAGKARAEIARLLSDAATTSDERVEGATLLRRLKDGASAEKLVDAVLTAEPEHEAGVALRTALLLDQKKESEAADVLRRAVSSPKAPVSHFQFLAALEQRLPPEPTAKERVLAVLDRGLERHPGSVELVRDRYRAMRLANDSRTLEFVERAAQEHDKPELKHLLVEVLREERRFDKADALVTRLLEAEPKNAKLATTLIGLVAAQAAEAAKSDDVTTESRLNERCQTLIQQFRAAFPEEPAFIQAESELAERTGDHARARELATELAGKFPASAAGPILRARHAQAEGKLEEVARAYEEALSRETGRADLELALAQTQLHLGKTDEAFRLASATVTARPELSEAVLLHAQTLAAREGSEKELEAYRTQAVDSLRQAIARSPRFGAAYHLAADIEMMRGRLPEAIALLSEALKATPADDSALSMLVQILAEPPGAGQPPRDADLARARKLAEDYAARDDDGTLLLAIAIGFHKAGQPDLALPWAESAAAKLDRPIVRLACGDILLAKAESTTDTATAKELLGRAIEHYDAVLAQNARSMEAVNNKAWILSHYFERHAEAKSLVEALVARTDAATLPAELFDTLGEILEALGERSEAESAYTRGLEKNRDHAVLNFHMGRLLANQTDRASRAEPYLRRAQAASASGRLSRAMASELDTLLTRLPR
jgi:tetratricopeptide (TPR) repeat protein